MITGTKVNFVYVESGASIPTPVDESTIYYVEDAQQMYVGSHLIADSSKIQDIKINGSSAVDPSTHEASIELPYNICINSIPSTPTAIATFSDGADMVMPSLTVGVNAWQEGSGDPSPSNVRPIHGWDSVNVVTNGINQWDEEWEVGSISDASGQDATNSNYRRSKNYISVKANIKYYFNVPSKYGTAYRFYQYKQNKDYIGIKTVDSDGTFETDNDCAFVRFRIATTEEYTNDISINYPSTDTSYHAYNGQTYTIDLNGTRYGGELDVVSGVLTVDRIKWTLTPTVNQIAGVGISDCIISIPADKTPIDWNVNVNKCMCNKLKVSNYSAQHDNHVHFPNSAIIALYLADEIGTTKQEWVDYLAQAQIDVSYIIATPLTIQLTPTAVKSLEGVNNVFADSGEILEGEYIANSSYVVDVAESIIKLGVDDITLAKNFADEYDATKSYAVGDYCTKDLVLYRCTTATTGTWDDTKWEAITVEEIIDDLDFSANAISYDNSESGLDATNVQDAIDELLARIAALENA